MKCLKSIRLLIGINWVAASAPLNGNFVDSPWPTYHSGPARQASTTLRGPESSNPNVQIRYFREDTKGCWAWDRGIDFGTSPWHTLSDKGYSDGNVRTLWGASLTHLYKYKLSSGGLDYVDNWEIGALLGVSWNFMHLRDGRVVVPAPLGYTKDNCHACFSLRPALLIFQDDGTNPDSSIQCTGKFEFTREVLDAACGFSDVIIGTTTVNTNLLMTGEVAVQLRRNEGSNQQTWLAVLDNAMTRILQCAQITPDGTATNGSPMEYGSSARETIYYLPTQFELISVKYNADTNTLTREASVSISYRSGRTGTTPTLLGFGSDADQFVLTVNSRCAVQDVFTGEITCDGNTNPSTLVAVPRPLGSGTIITTELPDFMDTTENSPAVSGNDIVICNYSGYTPDANKDGVPDRAVGIVKMSWSSASRSFDIDWSNAVLQCSGVPTISSSSNMVYFSGSESDFNTYFYGLRLNDDAAGLGGDVVVRTTVAPSKDDDQAIFDAGNNVLISDDGSAIFPGGTGLVRIHD